MHLKIAGGRLGVLGRRLGLATSLVVLATSTGCVTAAERAAQQAHDSRKATSHLEIGVDHLSNGRGAMALREFLAAEKLDPENPRVQYALGDAYLARGKRELAEQHLRRALEIFPDHHDARLSLSALLLIEKRFDEAIAECDRLVDDPTYPSPWRALTNKAWAEFKLGRMPEAQDGLELALEYRTDYWPATLALAILQNESGDRKQAIRLLRDIIAQAPGASVESEVNYRLAEIYVALGMRREAVGHLTASVARSPEGPWAKKSQEYLKLLH